MLFELEKMNRVEEGKEGYQDGSVGKWDRVVSPLTGKGYLSSFAQVWGLSLNG